MWISDPVVLPTLKKKTVMSLLKDFCKERMETDPTFSLGSRARKTGTARRGCTITLIEKLQIDLGDQKGALSRSGRTTEPQSKQDFSFLTRTQWETVDFLFTTALPTSFHS